MENNLQFTITAQDLASQSIAQIQGRFDNFVQSAVGGSKAVGDAQRKLAEESKKLASAQSSARMATFSLTQAIQDAPFGFRGVANNIEFLTQNLVTLSAQTGGAVGALKAIGATLSGPVGILFAVSAVSAAIQFLFPRFGQLASSADEAAKSTKKAADELERFYSIAEKRSGSPEVQRENLKLLQQESDLLGELIRTRQGIGQGVFVIPDSASAENKKKLEGFVSENSKKSLKDLQELFASLQTEIRATSAAAIEVVSAVDSVGKSAKDAEDKWLFDLKERVRLAEESARKLGAVTFKGADPTVPERYNKVLESIGLVLDENNKKFADFEAKNRGLLKDTGPRAEVKVTTPKIDKDATRKWVTDLTDGLNTLGATAENVNSLIIGSTQSAAAAITDAFFGATKSIAEFFRAMVKDIVRLLIEQLVVKGILGLLSKFIPGLNVTNTGSPVGPEGPSFGKTVSRNTGEDLTAKTVAKTAQTVAENVKNVTRNVTNVREDVRNTPTFSKIERADIRPAPMPVKSEKSVTLNININGNTATVKRSSVADRRAITQAINDALFSEKIGR